MLRDAIGGAGLAFYPQVALVLFLLVFFSICVYVFRKKRNSWETARQMPLDDGERRKEAGSAIPAVDDGKDETDV